MEWIYNGTQFLFRDNNAELPDAMLRTVSSPIAVYMIGRTNEGNGTFQYTSQLSVTRVTFDRVNITCTIDPISVADAQTDSLFVETSGKEKKFIDQ